MSREVIFTIKGDGDAVSSFVNERLVKPALAAASAERAELETSNLMNDLRREHASALADVQDEKQYVVAELEAAREKNDSDVRTMLKMQEEIGNWRHAAMAFQSQLQMVSRPEGPSKELKNKIFALFSLIGSRERVQSIKALREITGCNLVEGKVIVEKIFENFNQVEAKIIPLPPSSVSEQMKLLPEP